MESKFSSLLLPVLEPVFFFRALKNPSFFFGSEFWVGSRPDSLILGCSCLGSVLFSFELLDSDDSDVDIGDEAFGFGGFDATAGFTDPVDLAGLFFFSLLPQLLIERTKH